ncbi:hypothetical protein BGW36DRAFT_428933 [Talaromyces proteolyticus]|uniref:DUF803 domain protein n=1 Tax=Talaromyces proteolyticus TaxID=1131652 RepID=A0AAD4KLY7_9EURO|nr:uncharacterized protein BGW36DRAFT_428933 [Talaromyces proteolyticus]KAH8695040.1 hypothetical protein BGW36DRAFT_428933 [Talaromyces proteolyticus]
MGQLGDLSPEGSIAVGVLVGLISTSLQAIGLTLQRKSHLLEDEKSPYELRRPPYKRRRWQLGMLMFVVANIVGSTIQITTLPLPVLSTLQSSGLVFNTISATLILGEPFTKYSFLGTALVCIGAVLIATFGAVGEPAHTLDQLLELLHRRPFIAWMVVTGLIVVFVLAGSRLIKTLSSPNNFKSRFIKLNGALITPSRGKFYRGLAFGFCSGVLSAHTLLLAKSAVELLVRTVVDHVNQFNRWQSWLILIGMVCLALTQLYYMHRGLKLCSTSVLYPFVFCVYNIIAILDGLIYFRQASQLAGFHAGLIALGTIVLLGGVLCLSWRLEDIDNHVGVTLPSTSQTPLGPGMGMVEEVPERSENEELPIGERQPLLSIPRHESSHQRTPSLPVTSPYRYRAQTFSAQTFNNESAQIWADLDDSESEAALIQDSPLAPSRAPPTQYSRRRTLSLLSRGHGRRSLPSNDNPQKTWDHPAKSPHAVMGLLRNARRRQNPQGIGSRRVSAPVFMGGKSNALSPSNNDRESPRNYGTYGPLGGNSEAITDSENNHEDENLDSTLTNTLKRPFKLLQRWAAAGLISKSNTRDDEQDPPV